MTKRFPSPLHTGVYASAIGIFLADDQVFFLFPRTSQMHTFLSRPLLERLPRGDCSSFVVRTTSDGSASFFFFHADDPSPFPSPRSSPPLLCRNSIFRPAVLFYREFVGEPSPLSGTTRSLLPLAAFFDNRTRLHDDSSQMNFLSE